MTSYSYFAGIDWASQTHAVCVIDATGPVQLRLDIPHSQEDGLGYAIRESARLHSSAYVMSANLPSWEVITRLNSSVHRRDRALSQSALSVTV